MAAAPRRTWSGGCASERPQIPDRRTVRLALSSVSLRFSSARGPQAFEGAARLRCPSPRQSFPAAGALHPGRGNFHRARSPALRSTERGASRLQRRLLRSLGTAASLQALGHEAGRRRQWGVAYIRPSSRLFCSPSLSLGLHVANLPIPPAAADRVPYIVQCPILTPLGQGHGQVSPDPRLYKRGACPQAPTMYKRAHPARPWTRLKGVMGTSQFTSYLTLQPGVTDLGPPPQCW